MPALTVSCQCGTYICDTQNEFGWFFFQEFEKFVDGSGNDGFIVFSMGTVIESQFLPQYIVDSFKEAFSNIKQRVIWKFEKPLEGLSRNVMIAKWIPQQDLIGDNLCNIYFPQSLAY